MKDIPSKRTAAWNTALALLAGLGILISLLGIGIDALPGSYPGLSLPQLLLTAAGLTLALVAFALRSAAVHAGGGGGGEVWVAAISYCRHDPDCS